jgi:2-keto-3-deoxy-L-rhamnonate aldolase RhmA
VKGNPVKRTLAAGGVSIGTMIFEFPVVSIGRLAAHAGADFLLVDQEHTGMSLETAKAVIAASRGDEIVPLVRVPDAAYHLIASILDVGAAGVMVPMVEGIDEARSVVEWAKYPPLGRRGVGLLYRDEHEPGGPAPTMVRVNEDQLLILQIETRAALEEVEQIAALDGVDVLWVGHFDLTASMGITAQFEHADFLAALERVVAACRAHGKAAGIMVASVEDGRKALERGFRAIAYSGDLWLYQQALAEGVTALRAQAGR